MPVTMNLKGMRMVNTGVLDCADDLGRCYLRSLRSGAGSLRFACIVLACDVSFSLFANLEADSLKECATRLW